MNSPKFLAGAVLAFVALGLPSLAAQAQSQTDSPGTVDSHYDNHSREGNSSAATYPSTGGVSTETRTYGNGPTEDSRSTGAGASGGGGSGMGTDATGTAGTGNSTDAVDMRSGTAIGSDAPPPAIRRDSKPGIRQSGSDTTGKAASTKAATGIESQRQESGQATGAGSAGGGR